MKRQSALLPACLLLLWTLTAFVSCADEPAKPGIEVQHISDGIILKCKKGKIKTKSSEGEETFVATLPLDYNDDNSREYTCVEPAKGEEDSEVILSKIYVKFRSCDNCIELDEGTIAGLVTGNVVATIVIGVAVYLVMSQNRISPNTSHKKSSDRQHLVSNEMPRSTNDHYQVLNPRTRQGDTYGVLHK